MQWLVRRNPHFTLKLDYARSRLFIALHQDLFPHIRATWELGGGAIRVGEAPRWDQTSVVVEYHSNAHGVFWQHVVPALSALRQRYAAAGGRLVTVTTVREPASQIISWYRQWPPRRANKTIAPLQPWLANASGLLTRALAFVRGPSRIWHTSKLC